MEEGQKGLGLWIVGDGDAAALAWRAIESISSTGAVRSAASAGSPHAARASAAAALPSSPGSACATVGFHGQYSTRSIHQVEALFSGCDSAECWKSAEWGPSTLMVADPVAASLEVGKVSSGPASAVQLAEESLALVRDCALLLALEAADLRSEPDISFHGFTHRVDSFGWHGGPAKILLSGYTGLPSGA